MNRSKSANENSPMADSVRKKRLGQYFTGIPLARLLAALSNASSARSIIDPMGGTGDMLAACIEAGGGGQTCVSIEIDPLANHSAHERFAQTVPVAPLLMLGSAFDPSMIGQLSEKSFDLVITNPPYVRYQSLSKAHNGDLWLPSAVEIRNNLLDLIQIFPSLDRKDRELFSTLISRYSGLSDLAVPSWILCAMLTRIGGKLAMVVPETWLTRDYAQVIQYLLLRWFRIRVVVEDAQAVWFPDALVKTTLLVAERIERRPSAFTWSDEGYSHAHIDGHALDTRSIVGNLFPNDKNPEMALAKLLGNVSSDKKSYTRTLLRADWIPLRQKAENLRRSAAREDWLRVAEGVESCFRKTRGEIHADRGVLPSALARWLGHSSMARLTTLGQIGISVGQGLRTGANQFFYVEACGEDKRGLIFEPNPVFGIGRIHIPSNCALPVLRKQSELGSGYRLDASVLNGRVLALQGLALPEDLKEQGKISASVRKTCVPMSQELAELVRTAARTNVGTDTEAKWIPHMSAVRTNARAADSSDPQLPPRFWYTLPPFAPRHHPDLFVARVNNGHPKTILNASEQVLIDANFSTLWIQKSELFDRLALLALLNSSWCVAAMELTASVMGGGALKLEATHIRRLLIPQLTANQWKQLSKLGEKLASAKNAETTLGEIDILVIDALVGPDQLNEKRSLLNEIKNTQLTTRTKRKRR